MHFIFYIYLLSPHNNTNNIYCRHIPSERQVWHLLYYTKISWLCHLFTRSMFVWMSEKCGLPNLVVHGGLIPASVRLRPSRLRRFSSPIRGGKGEEGWFHSLQHRYRCPYTPGMQMELNDTNPNVHSLPLHQPSGIPIPLPYSLMQLFSVNSFHSCGWCFGSVSFRE